MIRDHFEHFLPVSAKHAAELARDHPGALILAGGTMTIPRMVTGILRPRTIVNVRDAGLSYVRLGQRGLAIGAATTYDELLRSEAAKSEYPLLISMAQTITGGAQILNQGTIGGSSCYAAPASDVPACLAALDAIMIVQSHEGCREIPVAGFFEDAFQTSLASTELLVEILIPRAHRHRSEGYIKQKHCNSSWPIVSAACVYNGEITRLGISGACRSPIAIELASSPADIFDNGLDQFKGTVLSELKAGWADELANAEYRRKIVIPIAMRALKLAERAVA